jgi:vesicle-fusing ATPase
LKGKTLVARKLASMVSAIPPKVICGPEIFSKFVGETEKTIRELFADAVKDFKQKGDASDIHVIIFDEVDLLFRKRGTGPETSVFDSAVNQLLSLMDGYDALNNILVIGLTNKKTTLDDALLRPGRFELQIEFVSEKRGRDR